MLGKIYAVLEKFLTPLQIQNLTLTLFGLFKIPLIYFIKARVVEFNDERVVLKVPLIRHTQNHMKAMYFGALAIGADLTGGVIAIDLIYRKSLPLQFVFKDMQVDFLKRAEEDTIFVCDQVAKVRVAVDEAMRTGERVNVPFDVVALNPVKCGKEPVAKFRLTLSLKVKSKR
jgi:hypothetical protein